MKILLATKNDGKIREIVDVIDLGIDFQTYQDFDSWPEVRETGKTFKENALLKAKVLSEYFDLPVLAEDSGLEVDALNGKPGIYSSRYAGPKASDEENIKKLLSSLEKETSLEKRAARFRSVAVFYDPAGGRQLIAEGKIEGNIAFEPKGEGGFGYDPVFIPQSYDVTMAQLTTSQKNAISHRGEALRQMKNILKEDLGL